MNIAINLLPFREHLAGAGNYAKNIVRELSFIDKENIYYLFVSTEGKRHFQVSNKNFITILNPIRSSCVICRILWEQLIFPLQLKKKKVDILFTPSVAIPLLYNGKMITTIHDIAFKKVKKKYPPLRRVYLSLITRSAIVKSSLIFTVSLFSKNEILKNYTVDPRKIIVTYNGVSPAFYIKQSKDYLLDIKNKYNLPDNYILYVGALEPGKNLERLILAFKNIVISQKHPNLYLVMTGGIKWKEEIINNTLSVIKNRVILLPYIPEEELPAIYKLSQILIYISLYEGFGLPILEAMATKIPVIASDSAVFREFAQNSAVFVDPCDEEVLQSKILELLLTDNIKKYIDTENGLKTAEKFNWKNSAVIILNSYKNA